MEFSVRNFGAFCFVICQCIIGTCVNTKKITAFDSDSWQGLPLEHSFESGPDAVFTRRGSIHFESPLKLGPGIVTMTIPLTSAEQSALKALAKRGGFYRVRVPTQLTPSGTVNEEDFPEAEDYVYTFTKASLLVESYLCDDITIHADQSGNVLSVMLSPAKGVCHALLLSNSRASFNSTVSLSLTVPGPLPDTQAFIQKLEDEKQQKAQGGGADNRSFFAKYWMYIIPVVLFMMMSGGGEQGRG